MGQAGNQWDRPETIGTGRESMGQAGNQWDRPGIIGTGPETATLAEGSGRVRVLSRQPALDRRGPMKAAAAARPKPRRGRRRSGTAGGRQRYVRLSADKSPGRQAKLQSLAVWWLLKQITAPGPRPRSSTNDLAPPPHMGWVSGRPYRPHWLAFGKGPRLPWLCHRERRGRPAREYRCLPRRGR